MTPAIDLPVQIWRAAQDVFRLRCRYNSMSLTHDQLNNVRSPRFQSAWQDLLWPLALSPSAADLCLTPEKICAGSGGIPFAPEHGPAQCLREATVSINRIRPWVDPDYYGWQVPDLERGAFDATEHYYLIGWRIGLDPSADFQTSPYLLEYPDVAAAGICPLDHFVEHGRGENRIGKRNHSDWGFVARDVRFDAIAKEIDRDWYLSRYPVPAGIDPGLHYLLVGWLRLYDPSPAFSTLFYLERSTDAQNAAFHPFAHFLLLGRAEGRLGTADGAVEEDDAIDRIIRPAVDTEYYQSRYPHVAALHVDPAKHYKVSGALSGLDPSADFSTEFYLALSPDVAVDENPLHHYLTQGRDAGRPGKPATLSLDVVRGVDEPASELVELVTGDVDVPFYLTRYDDVRRNDVAPVLHFLKHGGFEGRDPSPRFSTIDYLATHQDLLPLGINPLVHYLLWGRDEEDRRVAALGGQSVRRIVDSAVVPDPDLRAATFLPATTLRNASRTDAEPMHIGWVVPDFDVGGGGHMTIFRMVRWMEIFGHRCTIIVDRPMFDRTDDERRSLVSDKYQVVRADVVRASACNPATFDRLVATGWQTATWVASNAPAGCGFYFVQDYEPLFYPAGAYALSAGETYRLDLACICASDWLRQKMEQHGRTATAFELAADEVYSPRDTRSSNAVPRIAFYGRSHTSRRAVEIGYLALEILAARGVAFVVDVFGVEAPLSHAPFIAFHHGVADAETLRDLYTHADLGMCLSATNYSLVPQEMMATGLALVELDGESTRAAFPPGIVCLAGPSPSDVADALQRLLEREDERAALAERGLAWAGSLSWEKSARKVEAALVGDATAIPRRVPTPDGAPCASVIIPVYNGGPLLTRVIQQVLRQRTPWPFELVLIDSGSTDSSWEAIEGYGDCVRAYRIPKSEFQHGRTRNLGISLAKGEFAAFLTQDALPINDFWLYDLVTALQTNPTAAGAFGRHIAYPDGSAFVQRDLRDHFRAFDAYPALVSKFTNPQTWLSGDRGWRQFLHFFSDNNSCLRRSVWERHPYPEIDYGEDQVWAKQIIEAGYGKLYVRLAAVYHSHDYDAQQTFERARTEAEFFRNQFGYDDLAPVDLGAAAAVANANDLRWGERNGVDPAVIAERLKVNVYRLAGLAAGSVPSVNLGSSF